MWKKLIVAILAITVTATVGMAVVEMQGNTSAIAAETVQQTRDLAAPAEALPQATQAQNGSDSVVQQRQRGAASAGGAAQQEQSQSVNQVGEPWSVTATIVELGEVGMTVTTANGDQIYVELGPSFYWQAQGALAAGDEIMIDGFYNGEQYHAGSVTKADGAVLALRSATGQPLWSGGAENGGGASHGNQGAGTMQVAPEDWETFAAGVVTVNRNGLTVEMAEGATLMLSFGRADFWQSQAVQFAVGDAIEVKGFWQDGQFQTGQVTRLATGERLLLRDPNGRPLWGGPGRNGAQGNGGQGHGQSPSTNN